MSIRFVYEIDALRHSSMIHNILVNIVYLSVHTAT